MFNKNAVFGLVTVGIFLTILGLIGFSVYELASKEIPRKQEKEELQRIFCQKAMICPNDRHPVYYPVIDKCGCFLNE